MAWALRSLASRASSPTRWRRARRQLGFLPISIVAFVVLGSVLEGIPAIVLFGPLLFPIARAMGINEVHYAMVVMLAMGIGLFAPPFGVGYYAACAIGRASPDRAHAARSGRISARCWSRLILVAADAVVLDGLPVRPGQPHIEVRWRRSPCPCSPRRPSRRRPSVHAERRRVAAAADAGAVQGHALRTARSAPAPAR